MYSFNELSIFANLFVITEAKFALLSNAKANSFKVSKASGAPLIKVIIALLMSVNNNDISILFNLRIPLMSTFVKDTSCLLEIVFNLLSKSLLIIFPFILRLLFIFTSLLENSTKRSGNNVSIIKLPVPSPLICIDLLSLPIATIIKLNIYIIIFNLTFFINTEYIA